MSEQLKKAEGAQEWEIAISQMQEQFDRQTITHMQKYQGFVESIDELKGIVSELIVQKTGEKPLIKTGPGHATKGHHGATLRNHTMKLELPRFDGNDPYGWTFRVQEYFDFHETPDEQRLRITVPTGKLAKLMEKGNVEDYQAEFETLMNKVEEVTEHILISIFIAGLKNEIQQDLLVARPTTFDEAISLFRLFKSRQTARYLEQRSTTRWPGRNSNGQVNGANVGGEKSISQGLASQLQKAERAGAKFKRLTSVEMRDKRARGDCFNCDQKWTTSHKCTMQFLLMIEYPDEEEENLESDGEGVVITGDV
ncbi:Unknown protein [Striga hermonthica]|uniref:Retrotransposon gag domain-containing protein n=1 Tax=Striga hermonthica TaxID=68872 RepID=A0A9N7NKY1_STRHE|nr:Unknown protein [Striga hermonthica]